MSCSGQALSIWGHLSFSYGKFSFIISLMICSPLFSLISFLKLLLVILWMDSPTFSSFLFYFPSFPTLSFSSFHWIFYLHHIFNFQESFLVECSSFIASCFCVTGISYFVPLMLLINYSFEVPFFLHCLFAPVPFHFCVYFPYHVAGVHHMVTDSWTAPHTEEWDSKHFRRNSLCGVLICEIHKQVL